MKKKYFFCQNEYSSMIIDIYLKRDCVMYLKKKKKYTPIMPHKISTI